MDHWVCRERSIALAVVFASSVLRGATWYVSPGGDDSLPGNSWPAARLTLAGALALAGDGDEVWVAGGSYAGGFTLTSGVGLYGGFAGNETSRWARDPQANQTILNGGGGSVVIIPAGASASTVLDGFIIQGGAAAAGGGVHCGTGSAPRITGNTIRVNLATGCGGGIYCDTDSAPEIRLNAIQQNQAGTDGGGIACLDRSAPVVRGNTISLNQAGNDGGGIFCDDSPAIITNNSQLVGNTAGRHGGGIACRGSNSLGRVASNLLQGNGAAQRGGGLSLDELAAPQVRDNLVNGNRAADGGGIAAVQTTALLFRNTLASNQATGRGGGAFLGQAATPQCIGNVIAGNVAAGDGGGLFFDAGADASLVNNTITGNSSTGGEGGGLRLDGASPGLTNNLIVANSSGVCKDADDAPGFVCNDVTLSVGYAFSGFAADPTGSAGNIATNPLFAADGIHLSAASPCREAGTNAAVDVAWEDLDGEYRIQSPDGGRVDIGADEYHTGNMETPSVVPGGGTYDDPVTVSVRAVTAGSVVRFTTNGVPPDASAPALTNGATFVFTTAVTLKTRAFRTGWAPSPVRTDDYIFTRVATPCFSPGQGRYDSPLEVTITCDTPGAEIHWTTNAVDPTTNSPVIANGGSLTLTDPRLLKARAWKDPLDPSRIAVAGYAMDVFFVRKQAGGPTEDGLTWNTAFRTIQAGLDYAQTTGARRVWVAAYKPYGSACYPYYEHLIMPGGDGCELMGGFLGGEYTPEQRLHDWPEKAEVIVDGQHEVGKPVIRDWPLGSGQHTRIDSLTIRRGCNRCGSGVFISHYSSYIELANCRIHQNGYYYAPDSSVVLYGEMGGGVYIGLDRACHGWVHDCEISGNFAGQGGGIQGSGKLIVEDCGISGNSAHTRGGGGFFSDAGLDEEHPAWVRRCTVKGNGCNDYKHSGEGGGLVFTSSDQEWIVCENLIVENEARCRGGGVAVYDPRVILAANVIEDNSLKDEPEYGAGVYVEITDTSHTWFARLVNNYIRKNRGSFPTSGGGVAVLGNACYDALSDFEMRNNRIVENLATWGAGLFLQTRGYNVVCEYNTVAENVSPMGFDGYYIDFLPWPPEDPRPTGSWRQVGDIVLSSEHIERAAITNEIWYNDVIAWSGVLGSLTGQNGNIAVNPGLYAIDKSYRLTPESPVEDTVLDSVNLGQNGSSDDGGGYWLNFMRGSVVFNGMTRCPQQGRDMDCQGLDGERYDMGADEVNYCKRSVFDPPAGTHVPTNVMIACSTSNVVIRYTTDGSAPSPTSASMEPGGTVTLTQDTVLRAQAYWDGEYGVYWPGPVERTYYGPRSTLLMVR